MTRPYHRSAHLPSALRNRVLREQDSAKQWLPMEINVAQGVLRALSTKEAAAELGVSPKTLEYHRRLLKRRMGARNLVDLALKLADVAREGMA